MSAILERSRVVGIDTEWLPNIAEFRNLQRKEPRTAVIQLASDIDSMVFVVDVIAFLEGVDGGRRLVKVLGSIFRNPKILKLGKQNEHASSDHTLSILVDAVLEVNMLTSVFAFVKLFCRSI